MASSFNYIQRLVVNSSGHIFAATYYGVVRSTDGGANWQYVLAPSQGIGTGGTPTYDYFKDMVTDLEIATDDIVYAALNAGRIFRTNDGNTGTAWTEITPAGVPAGGERTELALAASTNGVGQVVYAVSRASNNVNYNQDVLFAPSCTYTDTNPYTYDSPRNTLYIPDECYPNQSIRRVTGVRSTLNYTRFVMYDYPSFMKLGIDQTSLFVGFSNGRVIKYTNLNQTTPTSTTVAGLGLPISSIDVGASDNELLVTLSSYGVSSVWYTNNGGATWVNKDPAGSGLADVPVRAGLFNPQNRQQVMLATDLGI